MSGCLCSQIPLLVADEIKRRVGAVLCWSPVPTRESLRQITPGQCEHRPQDHAFTSHRRGLAFQHCAFGQFGFSKDTKSRPLVMIFADKNPNFVWLYAHLVYCLYLYRFLIVKALEGVF